MRGAAWWLTSLLILGVGCSPFGASSSNSHPTATPTPESELTGIHKIQHIVVIMQENRSFDSYFGTYPGVDGLPMAGGQFTTCVPDPALGSCVRPYHNPRDVTGGGPHSQASAVADIDGGKMDGFIRETEAATRACVNNTDPNCALTGGHDVMGWKDARDIPNYWTYAHDFTLQDHMFEPNASWSQPEHLYLVSEWSAKCSRAADPMSCITALQFPDPPPDLNGKKKSSVRKLPNYAWTDLTYLLYKSHISWKYYVAPGTEPDCEDASERTCIQKPQNKGTPGIWNPLPYFSDVKQDNQVRNIQDLSRFYADAKAGTLPQVSWIAPNSKNSEHPPARVSTGQAYTTQLINSIMRGPDWASTAIFVSWDDWGGFYDHIVPPKVDSQGYGLRVPGLVISPYARRSYVDHQVLSHDAYVKFIEDVFLGGQRLDPATDGRPDSRPGVRENASILGDLTQDFDFTQQPLQPVILNPHPTPGPASIQGT